MISDIFKEIENEKIRQHKTIELVASENYVSKNIINAEGSILINKNAKGYLKKRYYSGCEFIDKIELMAINNAKKLFGVKYANVQAYSGTSANIAVYRALLKRGDKILSMSQEAGGHISHSDMNAMECNYKFVYYDVEKETSLINYDEVRKIALKEKPKLIIAGASSYSRKIDFAEFKEIAKACGAYLMVDMAQIAGIVAAGLHQNPCKYADVVTSTTHKTLRGPRGGLILTNKEDIIKKVDNILFPLIQGGALINVIAAKAVCFEEALKEEFKIYQKQVIKNAKVLCDVLKMEGFKVVAGGTDNHMVLVDVKKSVNMTGKEAEEILERIGITCNKNMVPFDITTPFITSGIRLGTAAMTTRGFKEREFLEVAKIISICLKNFENKSVLEALRFRVKTLCDNYPIYEEVL